MAFKLKPVDFDPFDPNDERNPAVRKEKAGTAVGQAVLDALSGCEGQRCDRCGAQGHQGGHRKAAAGCRARSR